MTPSPLLQGGADRGAAAPRGLRRAGGGERAEAQRHAARVLRAVPGQNGETDGAVEIRIQKRTVCFR